MTASLTEGHDLDDVLDRMGVAARNAARVLAKSDKTQRAAALHAMSQAVLAREKQEGPRRKLVGFEVTGRGIARHGYPVYIGDEEMGAVTSGSYAPFLQKNIGLAYLPTPRSAVGTEFEVDVRGRHVPARVVPTPFYKRPR